MPIRKSYPSIEYIKNNLIYKNGKLFWSDHAPYRSGLEAGCLRSSGKNRARRWGIKIGGIFYYRTTIIWAIYNNRWPENNEEIDHIDRNVLNDKTDNLRLSNKIDEDIKDGNAKNRTKYRNNKSGFKGVSWSKSHNKWIAQICSNWNRQCLGYFDSPEEAHAAYSRAAHDLHGEFACTD